MPDPEVVAELRRFRAAVPEVAVKRDLASAIRYGAWVNRLLSAYERRAQSVPPAQRPLLDLAHTHVRAMMDCPRRMRVDNTWPDDFVDEAVRAADALISMMDVERR